MKLHFIIISFLLLLLAGCNTGTNVAIVDNSTVMPVNVIQPIDDISGSFIEMPHSHHEIHEGNSYFVATNWDLVRLVNNDFIFVSPSTPDKWSHVLMDINFNYETTVSVFENSTVENCSNSYLPINRNRNSNLTADTQVLYNCDIISDGNSLGVIKIGAGKSFGGTARQENEIILQENTTYIFRFYTTEVGTYVSGFVDWYEDTNR
jgi:hypothetical protein